MVTLTAHSICGEMWGENRVKNGTELIGLSTVTLHLLLFCLCMNLWLKTKLLAAYRHCHPCLVPRDLLLFPVTYDVIKMKAV
jgi:hypothetical protein